MDLYDVILLYDTETEAETQLSEVGHVEPATQFSFNNSKIIDTIDPNN